MKTIKIQLSLLAFLFFFVACSKDQKHVNSLSESPWTQVSITVNGEVLDLGGTLTEHTMTFEECKVKNGECNGSESFTLELDDGAGTILGGATYTYKTHEDGTKFTLTLLNSTYDNVTTNCDSDCASIYDIVEITKDKYELTHVDETGNTWVRTIER